MNKALLLSGLMLVAAACSQSSDRYEDVSKLRGVGILSSPVVASPSTASTPSVVKLTFYAALPLGGTVTAATAYADTEGAVTTPPTPITMVSGSDHYEDHASLRLYSVQAQLTVPPAADLLFDPSSGFAVVHFATELSSNYGTQIIVGNLVVYPTGSAQVAAFSKLPTVAITAPTNKATVGNSKQTISMNLTPANNESYRVGWFVSGGTIENRNGTVTTWQPMGTGPFTVIATARGTQSAAFALNVVDITVN